MLRMFTSWSVTYPLSRLQARAGDDPAGRLTAAHSLVDAVAKAIIHELGKEQRRNFKDVQAVALALRLLECHPEQAAGDARTLASGLLAKASQVARVRRSSGDAHGHWPDDFPPSVEVAEAAAADALAVAEELARLFFNYLGRTLR